ncbi:NfeD family protein [Methylobacterium sp. NEAU 140]|uniref:NfeD family protein n=1 Tax=Methylobacterium sp. NEAU 140 TaxID=3064945 RepID=UPI002734DADE|nr:NfeD family protein [Methylobacterium sp. NEAU 140]MDP4024609.1 NfeD family protein [Methylobacterium sp. NEAU 140]
MIPDFLDALGPVWAWVVAGLALAAAEIVAPGVFLIWLGLAALATGLATALAPLPWPVQALLFAVLSLACVGLALRLNRRHVLRHGPRLNRPDRGLVGREATLSEPIVDGAGRLRCDDTLWRVTGPDLPAGARVRVTGIEGTVLVVRAA